MRQCLEGSYLAGFLNVALPKRPELNCETLARAWCILRDLADAMADGTKRLSFHSREAVERWALTLHRAIVMDALARALCCDNATANVVLSFLTWRPNAYKGLWGAPVVTVPGTEQVCLARSILVAGNPIRCAEIWMQNGGLDDNLSHNARGDAYEAELRRKVRKSIEDNPLLTDARCAEHAIKKSSDFPEQIDLLLQVGRVLLVGEVKCLLFPAEPREWLNYMEKLADAAAQARTKAEAIKSHPEVAARALDVAVDKFAPSRVVPLVVVNQGFGTSLEIEGCRVTDARFLDLYLSSGTYAPDVLVGRNGIEHVVGSSSLYHDQNEAASRLEAALSDPPPLRRFLDRLVWDASQFPTASGDPLLVETPRLRPMQEEERRSAELVAALAGLDETNDSFSSSARSPLRQPQDHVAVALAWPAQGGRAFARERPLPA